MSDKSGVGSRPVAPFIGPRRKPKAWGKIGYCPPGVYVCDDSTHGPEIVTSHPWPEIVSRNSPSPEAT